MEAGSSAAAAVAVGEERENPSEVTEKPLEKDEEETDVEETDVGSFGEFVPAPLVPLQHHLEKDKVFTPQSLFPPPKPSFFFWGYLLCPNWGFVVGICGSFLQIKLRFLTFWKLRHFGFCHCNFMSWC